jgi:hypothetical protein
LRWGGGAGPESSVIADVVLYRSRAVALPRVDFTPLGGFPPLAAFRCCHRQTTFPSSSKRVTALLASVDFHVSVRSFEALLRERVRTERASLRMFAGLPSLGLVPLRGHFVGSCVPMGFVGTRCLRCPYPFHRSVRWGTRSCTSAESRSVPCSEPCIRGPSRLGTPASSSRVCLIRRMKLQGWHESHSVPSSLMGR